MLVVHILRAAAAAAALASVTLAELNLPDEDFWGHRGVTFLLYASVAVLAFEVFPPKIDAIIAKSRISDLREYDRNVHSALSAALLEVARVTGLPSDQIGVHAFWSRRRWRWRRLVNVGGLRLRATPSMASPRWHPGKGVVGRAWEDDDYVVVDWEALQASAIANSAAAWRAASAVARYGLSWAELETTRDYKRIAARPIYSLNTGKRVGCVSLDAPLTVAQMEGPAVRDALRQLSLAIEVAGRPPAAWMRYN